MMRQKSYLKELFFNLCLIKDTVALDPNLRQLIQLNMNNTLSVLQSTKSSKEELEKFSKHWNTEESNV